MLSRQALEPERGMDTMWFAISEAGMDPVSRLTNTLLAGGRGRSGVEVGPDQIRVRMGGFRLTVPRSSIRSASRSQENVRGTYGVHSRSGRWLVNGSPDGLVELTIEPPCYAGRQPVSLFTRGKVNALTLSLADPDGFIAALQPPGQR
jgi:hypothetical protein